MRTFNYTFLLFISFTSWAQVKVEKYDSNCGEANAIAIVRTNDKNASFEWGSQINAVDSIAYNLNPGNYTVKITLSNLSQIIYTFNVNNLESCSITQNYGFGVVLEEQGHVRLSNYNNWSSVSYDWDMGDGTIYTDHRQPSVHKYQNPGMYKIKLILKTAGKQIIHSKDIVIEPWELEMRGSSINEVVKSTSVFQVYQQLECGGRSFVFANLSNSSINRKLYTFNDTNDEFVELPIDEVHWNISEKSKRNVACYNNKIYFSGRIGNSGYELCESNGTSQGTRVVEDFNSSAQTSLNPKSFKVLNNELYLGSDPRSSCCGTTRMYKYDGQNLEVVSSFENYNVRESDVFNGQLIIASYGLRMLNQNNTIQLLPGTNYVELIGKIGSYYYFSNKVSGDNFNTGLWKTDGTVQGTSLVKGGLTIYLNSNFSTSEFVNNKLVFTNYSNPNGVEIWSSDGTTSGTNVLYLFENGPLETSISEFLKKGNKVYFLPNVGNEFFAQLWQTDGTTLGTIKTLEVDYPVYRSGTHENLIDGKDRLIFYSQNNLISFDPETNSFSETELGCSEFSYIHYNSFIHSSGKVFLNGISSGNFYLYNFCNYSVPKLEDKITKWEEESTVQLPQEYQIKWFDNVNTCTSFTYSNPRQFVGPLPERFKYSIIDQFGCESKKQIYSNYLKGELECDVVNSSRCNINEIRIQIKVSDYFLDGNSFNIVLINKSTSEEIVLSTAVVNNELVGQIPLNFQIEDLDFKIRSSNPSKDFQVYPVPKIIESNSALILGSKTFIQGDSSLISVILSGNPPYSFSINSDFFSFEKSIFQFYVQPNESQNYLLDDIKNSCGIVLNKPYPIVNLKLSKCLRSISQTGSLVSGEFNSLNVLESNGTGNTSIDLIYKSEKHILLKSGFFIDQGGVFMADIEPCSY